VTADHRQQLAHFPALDQHIKHFALGIVLRSDMESLLTTDFRGLDVVTRRIEIRVATIDRTLRESDRATMPR
jgi:hypothetical protein